MRVLESKVKLNQDNEQVPLKILSDPLWLLIVRYTIIRRKKNSGATQLCLSLFSQYIYYIHHTMKIQLFTAGILFAATAVAQQGLTQGSGTMQSNLPAAHYFNSTDYSKLKGKGTLPEGNIIEVVAPLTDSTYVPVGGERSTGCGCYVEPDGSYLLALPATDDGSSGLINLPFTFCLYGNNYNSLYINNNGNVSFGTPYGTFSASGFPSTSFVMVAPFWGDVDTRFGAGQVIYKIYPNAIYVNWKDVGYYNVHTDKLNSFQLILSDGTDTTIGIGNNVAFCYKDMQWTTGDASSGVGGFGGIAATVGANKGTGGTDYIQFGRFDQPGTAYDGPVGLNDGVSWLDYQSFKFSTCVTTSNVQPIFVDFSPAMANTAYDCGTTAGDTVKICATGDTLYFSATVFDANVSDIVNLSVTSSSPVGFYPIDTIVGNPSTISWMFIADPANFGFNSFTVTATDNGTPMLSATAGFLVYVDTTGVGSFNTTISGDTMLCAGETTTLSVPPLFDTYDWTSGSASNTSGTVGPGIHYVTLTKNGCFKSFDQEVYLVPNPVPVINGNTGLCGGPSIFTSDSTYATYNWTLTGMGSISTTNSATVNSTGTLTLTVTNSYGCTGSSSVVITNGPTVTINPALTEGCTGDVIDLTATASGPGTFLWSNGDTDNSASFTSTTNAIVTFTDAGGCTVSDSMQVTIYETPNIYISTMDSVVCMGDSIVLTVAGNIAGGNISWALGPTTPSITVYSGGSASVTVNNHGCVDSDVIPLTFLPNPTVNITGPLAWCSNITNYLTANASTSGTYVWNTGATGSQTTPAGSGNYTVEFTDNNGCKATASHAVVIYPTPVASFTASPESPYISTDLPVYVTYTNTSTIASPGTIISNTWAVNDTVQAITTDYTHTYVTYGVNMVTLYVVSADGCIDSTSMEYEVAPVLMMPNIFTPNGTGYNNILSIKNLEYYGPAQLNIYNRWGNPVLQTTDYRNNWDGTKNGSDVAEGVYYYEMIIKTGKVYTGTIQIAR